MTMIKNAGSITYVSGDLFKECFKSDSNEDKVIVHVVNDKHKYGAGFSGVLNHFYPIVKVHYYNTRPLRLGSVILSLVEDGLGLRASTFVASLVAQRGVYDMFSNPKPIDYDALESSLRELSALLPDDRAVTIHMPRIGCGLARGDWGIVEVIIINTLVSNGADVFVYTLNN